MVDFDVLCLFMLDNVEEWCYFVIASLHLTRADECARLSGLEGRAAAAAELAMLHEARALGTHGGSRKAPARPRRARHCLRVRIGRGRTRAIYCSWPRSKLIVYEHSVTRVLDLNSSRNPATLIRRPEQEQMEG
jgi:hypothetical protein